MTYVLSDIHGNLRLYRGILEQINLQPEDTLYVLGDVIDRHPDGITILRELMAMPNVIMLLGNHEDMMLSALTMRVDPDDYWSVQMRRDAYNPGSGLTVNLTKEQQYEIHLKRAKHIMHVAAAHGAEVLILGAFGCGAFQNDPEAVAAAYRDALAEYGKYFDEIEFAVFCRGYETGNYDAFRKTIR